MKQRKANKYIKNLVKNNLNETKAYQETNDCAYSTAKSNAYKTYDKLEDKHFQEMIDTMEKYGHFPLEKVKPEYIIGKLNELANNAENEGVKCRALELLGKFRALFVDKVESKDTTLTPALEEAISNHNRLNNLGDN